jgi:hypothetical protein
MAGERDGGKKPSLKPIKGGLITEIRWKGLLIAAAPKDSPPFPVDALAFEEDTFLVMSADATVRDPKIPLIRIMSRLIETKPRAPGTVLVQGHSPVRLLAIVHDFNEDPSWKEDWIQAGLDGIFEAAEQLGTRSLGLPVLGTVHGSLDRDRGLLLLAESLRRRTLSDLTRLWLVVPPGGTRGALQSLQQHLQA